MLVRPVLEHIGRVIHVVLVQEGQVGRFHEIDEMIVFKGHPFRVDLPEHVLRSHLENRSASKGRRAIGTENGLKGMAKLVGQDAIGSANQSACGSPQRADFVINTAAERRAAAAANDEDQELVFRREGFFLIDPFQRIRVVVVECSHSLRAKSTSKRLL